PGGAVPGVRDAGGELPDRQRPRGRGRGDADDPRPAGRARPGGAARPVGGAGVQRRPAARQRPAVTAALLYRPFTASGRAFPFAGHTSTSAAGVSFFSRNAGAWYVAA